MHEPRKHDAGGSLTQSVRQFRRVARLAAADPLRLMPLDPLTRLVSLSAPIAALIDVAPFERLRDTMSAPPAAPRRDAAGAKRPPLANTGGARPRRVAAGTSTGEVAAAHATPAAAPQIPSPSRSSHVPSGAEALRHEASSTATLAERRAALRRRNVESGSPSPSTSRAVARAKGTAGSPSHRSGAISATVPPGRRQPNDEETDPVRELAAAAPFEPALFDRDGALATADGPFDPRVLHPASQAPSPLGERHTATRQNEVAVDSAPREQFERPLADDPSRSPVHSGRVGVGLPAAHTSSSHLAALPPMDARRLSQRDAGAANRRRTWEPASELELADDIFDALYRDGVDLSWP